MKGVNPLLIPVKLGWKRELVMFNNRGRRKVYYIAPCGRRLRSYEEVHRFGSFMGPYIKYDRIFLAFFDPLLYGVQRYPAWV